MRSFVVLISTLCFLAAPVLSACHNYVLISSRGTGEPQGPSIGFKGMINETLTRIPGGIEYDTVYPAQFDNNEPVGGADIVRYINAGLADCPNQKYALFGYSQGATVTAIALANYTDRASAGFKAIKSVVVIGNPEHKANQTANVDEHGGKTTSPYYGSLYDYKPRIPNVWYGTTKLLDICYTNDAVCLGLTPGSAATLGSAHFLYGFDEGVQKLGGDFTVKQLRAATTTVIMNPHNDPLMSFIHRWTHQNIRRIAMAYMTKGGWEGWAQVELAHQLALFGHQVLPNAHQGTIWPYREVHVYKGRGREAADLVIQLPTHTFIIELKCESFHNADAFIGALEADWNKLTKGDLEHPYRPCTAYCVGISVGHDVYTKMIDNNSLAGRNGTFQATSTHVIQRQDDVSFAGAFVWWTKHNVD